MPNRMQPGCKCCGGGICTTALTICVKCGTTPQEGVAVEVHRGGTLVDSCVTDSGGCCATQIEGPEPTEIRVDGAVVPFTPACVPETINIVGKTCQDCIDDGPAEVTLGTPYGSVVLQKGASGYSGTGTIPSVPDVTRLFCFGGTGGDACGANPQTFDLPVLYELGCDLFDGTILRLEVFASACDRGEFEPTPPPRFAKAVCYDGSSVDGSGNTLLFWNASAGYASDEITVGNCVPCGEGLEFALDLADFGKSPGLFTVEGGLSP